MHKATARSDHRVEDCWDLTPLCASVEQWEKDAAALEIEVERFGKLSGGGGAVRSARNLARLFDRYTSICQENERLSHFAFQWYCEDMGDAGRQQVFQSAQRMSTHVGACISFFLPQILQLPESRLQGLAKRSDYADYRVLLQRMLRQRPHVLSVELEHQLAMLGELQELPENGFVTLVDVDFDFPAVETREGPVPLTHASYHILLCHHTRAVREQAYKNYLTRYHGHRQVLTTLYAGSIKQNIFNARVRGHAGARAAALFGDNVPEELYDRLIGAVRRNLPVLHRYYRVRAKALQLDTLRLHDVHVPLARETTANYPYEQAVETVVAALAPLGHQYCAELKGGLLESGGGGARWVDRYENRGKRSGAFMISAYGTHPYILLNYDSRQLRSTFTLAHEAGHAMHSLYSARSNPFSHYRYSIFAAEVASTVNEQLLYAYLTRKTDTAPPGGGGDTTDREQQDRAKLYTYLLTDHIKDIVSTLFRQTMFAEFELAAHRQLIDNGNLTYAWVERAYQELLVDYFGTSVEIDAFDAIEALRIPHFYRAFYTYQYATGISAAITIARRLHGGGGYTPRYIEFLKSGGRHFPLDALKMAEVDFSTDEPFETAFQHFDELVGALEKQIQ